MILSSQNSHLVSAFGHEGAIDIMKEAGYDAIDMSLFCMSNDEDVFNSDGYKARALEISHMLTSLEFPSISPTSPSLLIGITRTNMRSVSSPVRSADLR
jgi:hypothetical protein